MGPLASAQEPFATHRSHIDPSKVDSWIAVAADGSVTAYSGKVELGQGMFTAQTQLVAEELCVAIEKVRLVQGDTAVCPDQGTTSGSQSTPTNFNDESLAQAAATAREALVNMAAQRLGESADGLTAMQGVVSGKRGRVSYAELIGSNKFDLPVNVRAKRRTAEQWNVLGQPVPALDRAALMTGRFEFVHNVRVPGMLHGRVIRPRPLELRFRASIEIRSRGFPGL
jgi:CO/xanthine dehydrogenase Mo-binding subunit